MPEIRFVIEIDYELACACADILASWWADEVWVTDKGRSMAMELDDEMSHGATDSGLRSSCGV